MKKQLSFLLIAIVLFLVIANVEGLSLQTVQAQASTAIPSKKATVPRTQRVATGTHAATTPGTTPHARHCWLPCDLATCATAAVSPCCRLRHWTLHTRTTDHCARTPTHAPITSNIIAATSASRADLSRTVTSRPLR